MIAMNLEIPQLQAQLPLPVFRVEGSVREKHAALEKLILQLMKRRQFATASLEDVAHILGLELPFLEVALRNLLKLRQLNLLEPQLQGQLYAVRFNQLEVSPLHQNMELVRAEHYCYDFLRQQVLASSNRQAQAQRLTLPQVAIPASQQPLVHEKLRAAFIESQRILDPHDYRFNMHVLEHEYIPVPLSLSVHQGRGELELGSPEAAIRSHLQTIDRKQWQEWIPVLRDYLKHQENFELLDQLPPQDEVIIPVPELKQFTTVQFKRTHGSYPGIKIHVECTKSNPIPSTIYLQNASGGSSPLVLQQPRFIEAIYNSGMFGTHLEFERNKSTVAGDFYLSAATLCYRRSGYSELEFAGTKLYVPVEGLYPLDAREARSFDGETLLEQLHAELISLEGAQALQLPLEWSLATTSNDASYVNVNEYIRLMVYMSAWLPPATVIKSMGTVSIKVVSEFMAEYSRVMSRAWQHASWQVADYRNTGELRLHQEVFDERKLTFASYAADFQHEIISDLLNAANLGKNLPAYFSLIEDQPLHNFYQFAKNRRPYFNWVNRDGDLLRVEDFPYVREFTHFERELETLSEALIEFCKYECKEQVRGLFLELGAKVDKVKHKLNDSFYTLPERVSRPVLIVDTNVLMGLGASAEKPDVIDFIEQLQNKYYIIVPEFVIGELNNLKNSKDMTKARHARHGMRICEDVNQNTNNDYKDVIFELLDTSTEVVRDSEEMDVKIRAVACSYLRYEVFLLSFDRGNRVMSMNLGLQIASETEQLANLISPVTKKGSGSFKR